VFIGVSQGRAILSRHGLERLDGAGNRNTFEIWIARNGMPEMVPFKDARQEEFLKAAIDELVKKYPLP
jgi:hypothetical protein